MKKFILVILLVALVLTSCNKIDNNIKTDENDITQETDKQTSNENEQSNTISQDNSIKISDTSTEKNYDVVDEKYDDKGIHITYPQIINLNDNDKQKKINEMIKAESLIILSDCDDDGAVLEINYKITLESKNVLSLQFSGQEDHKGTPHPTSHLYTININMNKCTKLKLKDFINIDEKLVDKFRQYKVSEPDETGIAEKAFIFFINDKTTGTTEYLLECFEVADSSYEDTPYTFSYLTEDSMVISTEILHGLGDHIEIKLKYKDIKDNIKSDNEIWEGIFNPNK